MEKERKDVLLHPMLVFLILLLGVIIVGAIYLRRMQVSPSFYKQTTVNGFDVSGMTLDQVQIAINSALQQDLVVTEEGEIILKGKMADFGYSIDMDALLRTLEKEVAWERRDFHTMLNNLLHETEAYLAVPHELDEKVFDSKVTLDALKVARFPSEDAKLKYDKKTKQYSILPEVYGNEISLESLRAAVKEGMEQYLSSDMDGEDCVIEIPDSFYTLPTVKQDDPTLVYTMGEYNKYCRTKVVYTFGSAQEVVGWKMIRSWLVLEDGTSHFDEDKIREYLAELGKKYDTRHLDRYFTNSYGFNVYIPGYDNEYGYTVDEYAEFYHLMEDLSSNETITREPEYISHNDFGNPYYYTREGKDDICGTYVECSLSDQHLWFYWNYGLVVESDFVSGDVSKNHQTKTGCFPLAYKESPSILVGDNANAEDNYRTEVQYWMPFYEGQGLHDATWRGSFGGSIYQTNGSHGCINLPISAAATIYSYIEEGVPIIIY